MSLTLKWMTADGKRAFIIHEDGRLFDYRFRDWTPGIAAAGGPVGLTCSYTSVDFPEQVCEMAAERGWDKIDKEFPLMGDLNEWVTHYLLAKSLQS